MSYSIAVNKGGKITEWWTIKVKEYREQGLNHYMFTGWRPCPDFQLGLLISANSIGNKNKAKLLQISRKQFACRQNRSPPLEQDSCLGYTSFTFIDGLMIRGTQPNKKQL